MASPQLILELSKGFFVRNNPIRDAINSIAGTLQNLLTFKSKMRLLKYKFMLAQQQLNTMEEHITLAATEPRGSRIDRPF